MPISCPTCGGTGEVTPKCPVCFDGGYVRDGDEVVPCDEPGCAWWIDQDREDMRRRIVAGLPVNVDLVPLELFERSSPPRARFGGIRNPAWTPPEHPVLTDLEQARFFARLTADERERFRSRVLAEVA